MSKVPLFLLLLFNFSFARYFQMPIDTVLWFKPGKGQRLGQDSTYFPRNIFKLPDSSASEKIPSSKPEDICSIGLGGEIVVGFKDFVLIDADGYDFTIFENAFINPITGRVFAEPAVVSVSLDGANFIDFPCDFQTLYGCAGTRPTNGKANPYDPSVSGGNSFDLSALGLSKVRYIKIKDVCDIIREDTSNPFFDPLLSGFDLDCVVGLHLIPFQTNASTVSDKNYSIFSQSDFLIIHSFEKIHFVVFDLIGHKIYETEVNGFEYIDINSFTNTVLFCILNSDKFLEIIKVVNVEGQIFISSY
ncbi:MAG: hypothetical protein N2517_03920 [Ignavibacteria bacterium]|nr:hypothetical protein [Ignavibacteria bacterium]